MNSFLLFLCSRGMEPLILIAHALMVVGVVSVLLAILFVFRAAPSNETLRKYSFGARMRLMYLHFDRRPPSEISPEDIEAFRKFRKRIFAWGLALFGYTLLRVLFTNVFAPRVFLMFATNQCAK